MKQLPLLYFLVVQYILPANGAALPQNQASNDPTYSAHYALHRDTCRWTNCNEPCPEDFVKVPRYGGGQGEMMWDHAHCRGRGVSTFCCPEHIEQPKCEWAGFIDGACRGGCPNDKAQVGTSSVACNALSDSSAPYQSACCSITESTVAYARCKWFSDCGKARHPATCQNLKPLRDKLIFQASKGFGGERPCSAGARAFCCDEPPTAFKNCKWYKHETNHVGDVGCEISCPKNHIRIGVQKDDCPQGSLGAYCCAGDDPIDVDGSPFKFKHLLKFYVDKVGDQCPQSRLPFPEDYIKDNKVSMFEWSTLGEQSPDDVAAAWSGLDGKLISLFRKENVKPLCLQAYDIIFRFLLNARYVQSYIPPLGKKLIKIYNEIFAKGFPGLSFEEVSQYLQKHPFEDQFGVIFDILFDRHGWSVAYQEMRPLDRDLCHWPPGKRLDIESGLISTSDSAHTPSSNGNQSSFLGRRHIGKSLETIPGPLRRPTFGMILAGIMTGRLTLHYAQWLWYADRENRHGARGQRAGPMLELVYWIGEHPGQNPTASEEQQDQLDLYRDTEIRLRGEPRDQDRWVVFHLHFNGNRDMINTLFFEVNGRTFTGISAISMYHAQSFERAGPQRDMWRVQGGLNPTARNKRMVFECEINPGDREQYGVMVAGPELRTSPGSDTHLLDRWLNRLYLDGYLRYHAFQYILNDNTPLIRRTRHGERISDIDPRRVWESGWRDHHEEPARPEDIMSNVRWNSPFLMLLIGDDENIMPVVHIPEEPLSPGWLPELPPQPPGPPTEPYPFEQPPPPPPSENYPHEPTPSSPPHDELKLQAGGKNLVEVAA